jgi:2-polyprenyl-3-methyl-5-hydroxy-6-metoxy-1,4-benzoquinol methylase
MIDGKGPAAARAGAERPWDERDGPMMTNKGTDREREDRAYLRRITKLSFDEERWSRESILEMRDLLSPWNHNIKLPLGIYTTDCPDYYPAHEEILTIINHQLGGAFKGKRILDVGCLEGYFAAECALQGAAVVGVDGRVINVRKCQFVQSVLAIQNLTFVKDDGMRVTRKKYGSFDVVLALGLLYHLGNPFQFLANMADLCDGFLLIDSHIALADQPRSIKGGWRPELSGLREFKVGEKTYTGRLFREFDPGATQLSKDLSSTASLRNDSSVWLTEDSLTRLLRDVGFDQVCKFLFPKDEETWWSDVRADARVLVLAVKNRRPFHSKIFDGR